MVRMSDTFSGHPCRGVIATIPPPQVDFFLRVSSGPYHQDETDANHGHDDRRPLEALARTE